MSLCDLHSTRKWRRRWACLDEIKFRNVVGRSRVKKRSEKEFIFLSVEFRSGTAMYEQSPFSRVWDVARLCDSLGENAKDMSKLIFAEAFCIGVKDGHLLSLVPATETTDQTLVVCEFFRPAPGDEKRYPKQRTPEGALQKWPDARVSIDGRFLERVEEEVNSDTSQKTLVFKCYRESFADVNRAADFDLVEYVKTRSLGDCSAKEIVRELPLSMGTLRIVGVGKSVVCAVPKEEVSVDLGSRLSKALESVYPLLGSQKGVERLFRFSESRNSCGFTVLKWTCLLPPSRMEAFFGFQPSDLVEEALAELRAYRDRV